MSRIALFIAGLVFTSIAVQTSAAQDSSKGGTIADEIGQDGNRLPAAVSPRSQPIASGHILKLRRTAFYYSWRNHCYTQDRNHNWYQVDPRLC